MTLFDDIVTPLDHPWITELRLPLVENFHSARTSYPVALVYPTEAQAGDDLNQFIIPDESEARILSAYNEFRSDRWYNPMYVANVIRKNILDVDRSSQTFTFGKMETRGWVYSSSGWSTPPWPFVGSEYHFANVEQLLDHVNKDSNVWPDWKLANASLFVSDTAS